MSRDNDLVGKPDMGGKHGGQAGQPKPPPRPREGEQDEDAMAALVGLIENYFDEGE